jgi:hypothetical protein
MPLQTENSAYENIKDEPFTTDKSCHLLYRPSNNENTTNHIYMLGGAC